MKVIRLVASLFTLLVAHRS